eukprot:1885422-Lingulodinium_polyedra.AAC.1
MPNGSKPYCSGATACRTRCNLRSRVMSSSHDATERYINEINRIKRRSRNGAPAAHPPRGGARSP